MNILKKSVRYALLASLTAAAVLVSPIGGKSIAYAAEEAKKEKPKVLPYPDEYKRKVPKRKKRSSAAPSLSFFNKIQKVQALIEEKDLVTAKADLVKMESRKMNTAEQATLFNMLAYVELENDNMNGAMTYYVKMLALPNLNFTMEDSIRFRVSQMYAASEKFEQSIKEWDTWYIYQAEPTAQAYQFRAVVLYQMGRFKEGLENMVTANAILKAQGFAPKEGWYAMLRAFYFELGNYDKMRDTLEFMVMHWEKADYWVQLAAIYSELKQEDKQLAVMDVAYKQGYLTKENHLVNLAQLYVYNTVPWKGAKVMEEGFSSEVIEDTQKHQQILGQAYLLAKEYQRAVKPYTRSAELSDDGELFITLAQVYIELDQWDNVIMASNKALKKGELDRPDLVNMTLGMAYYNKDQLSKALKSFRQAAKNKDSKKTASSWIKFLTGEMDRREKIRQAAK